LLSLVMALATWLMLLRLFRDLTGQVWPAALITAAIALHPYMVALGILICICFLAGIAARRALARKFTKTVESQLMMLFPKYAIYKDILAGNIGGETATPSLTPVRVKLQDRTQIGYESGRTEDGLVIVYLPGAPDPWNGSVAMVEPEQISALEVDFNETAAICERLGRESEELLKSRPQ